MPVDQAPNPPYPYPPNDPIPCGIIPKIVRTALRSTDSNAHRKALADIEDLLKKRPAKKKAK